MDRDFCVICIIQSIGDGDGAEDNRAHETEQTHAALAFAKAEACNMEGSEHGKNIGEQGVTIIMDGRISVPCLEANDQSDDQVEADAHIKQCMRRLPHVTAIGKEAHADSRDDAERRQKVGQKFCKFRSGRDIDAGGSLTVIPKQNVTDAQKCRRTEEHHGRHRCSHRPGPFGMPLKTPKDNDRAEGKKQADDRQYFIYDGPFGNGAVGKQLIFAHHVTQDKCADGTKGCGSEKLTLIIV